jgi:hypothetical protein
MSGRVVKRHASGAPRPVSEPWLTSLARLVRLDREGVRPITAAETQCILEAFERLIAEERAA